MPRYFLTRHAIPRGVTTSRPWRSPLGIACLVKKYLHFVTTDNPTQEVTGNLLRDAYDITSWVELSVVTKWQLFCWLKSYPVVSRDNEFFITGYDFNQQNNCEFLLSPWTLKARLSEALVKGTHGCSLSFCFGRAFKVHGDSRNGNIFYWEIREATGNLLR